MLTLVLDQGRCWSKTLNTVGSKGACNRHPRHFAVNQGWCIPLTLAIAIQFLFASALSAAPVVFNWSNISNPGDVVSLQGSGFGSGPTVWCSTNGGTAAELTVVNSGNNVVQFQMPSPLGQYAVYVKNGSTASNTVYVNQAKPMHFDTPEVAESGTFRIFGRNLFATGFTPVVTFVSGSNNYTATINSGPTYNTLSVTAPSSIPNGTYSVYVSNGMGTLATAEALCPVQMTIVTAGSDTFGLGVPWAANLTFGSNVYNVETDSRLTVHAVGNGTNNDEPAIQDAINIASTAGGGVVYLPAGTFLLEVSSGPALSMANDVVIEGDGQSSTTMEYGYGTPGSNFYAVSFYGVTESGLCDLSITNLNQGNAWTNINSIATGGTCSQLFMVDVTANIGPCQQMYWTGNLMVIKGCSFTALYTIITMGESTNFRVSNNTFTQTLGVNLSLAGLGTDYGVVENNTFSLNANGGTVVSGNTRHGIALGFAHNIAILNNTWSVFNGTPTYNNDGESILSEGGAGGRTGEETGTVTSATSTTVNTSQSIAYIAGTVIAIVNGTGTGQWRTISGRSGSTLTVSSAWAVTPDSTSVYSIFVWSNQNTTISGNNFTNWLRGIWDYSGASTDTQVTGNTLNTMDGIFYESTQNVDNGNGEFDPIWNNVVDHNTLSSSSSTASYINFTGDLQETTSLIGTLVLNDQVYDNTINGDNITATGYEPTGPFENDPAWTEGYCNYLRVEASPYNDQSIPAMLGTIFQYDTANDCGVQAYLFNGGDYQTTIANYTDNSGDPTFLTDSDYYWNTSGTHASVSTVVLGGPASPTGLMATAGNTQVALSWSASDGATTYNLYRGTSSGGEGTSPIVTGISTTSYTNTGLTNGTDYYYKVAAVNSYGTSGYSNEANATPTSTTNTAWVTGTTTGTVRNNYTGFVGMQFTTGSSSVTVTQLGRWIVSGNSSAHTVKLTLASTGVDVTNGSVSVNTSGQTAGQYAYVNLTGAITLPANTAYYLTTDETSGGDSWLNDNTTITTTSVAASNNGEYYASGWVNDNSTANTSFGPVSFMYSGTGGSAPAAPTGLGATAGNAQVALAWNSSSGATSYNVYRGTSSGGESSTAIATGISTTSYTDTTVTNGTEYYYEVKAVNSNGNSGYSNEANATPTSGSAPSAPTGLTATAGDSQVSLTWNSSSGATSYNVYRGTSSGGESSTAIATGIATTSYVNTGLTYGVTYYYEVKAVNSNGNSGYSNEANASPTTVAWVTGTTTGTVRSNYTGFVGMKFTTGSSAVTVQRLGRWIVSGNSGSHEVKLTLASSGVDVSGGSVTVNTSGQTAGQYCYVTLSSPITLSASTAYYLTTDETNGGDSWYNDNTTITTTGVASSNNGEYYASGWVNDNSTADTSFGPVSFTY
jgi:fibronectin type 3 domain-containing protein/sarcosine oxidase gamma subunit